MLVDRLHRFPPRYGPEWGSGGIFGLRYHKGVLYFTLAFEAEAHFIRSDGERVYRFQLVGGEPGPRSGGDTYNAVEVVDEYVYFGGWVHAPAIYGGRRGRGGIILFHNKFSHLHSYNVYEDEVKLLWSDTIRHESKWAGEISEIVYDPVNDRLVVARADGHEHLGIYSIDRRSGREELLSKDPGLKGCLYLDYACFDIMKDWRRGVEGVQCLDLITGEWIKQPVEDYSKISLDGYGVQWPLPGCAVSAYARLFLFIRGGLLVGNPLSPEVEELRFVRLFDFGFSGYSPTRTTALPVGGGILVAFNAFTHGLLWPRDDFERLVARVTMRIVGPSVLVYITPPTARIVGALGARITSLERIGDRILAGTSTTANLMAQDASPIDAGYRDIVALSTEILNRSPPPVTFTLLGEQVGGGTWGGIPLWGYGEPSLLLKASKENELYVYLYDLSLPPSEAEIDRVEIKEGKNVIELEGYRGIVSFRLRDADPQALIRVNLA